MPNSQSMVPIVDLLIEGDVDAALEHLLMENQEQQIVRAMGGDRMPMNYLLKFEEYLDDHDIYLFDGWEDVQVCYKPRIDKFWCTFYVHCPKGTDLRGALRITNDKEEQNEIKQKTTDDGTILQFRILRRYLDEVEKNNQERAEELSTEEMEFL
jgi:hypothetical protein